MSFVLCSQCSRHVKTVEAACPFCGASIEVTAPVGNASLSGARSRSRLLFGAAAAAVAGATAVTAATGCSTTTAMYGTPMEYTDGSVDGGAAFPAYGGPSPALDSGATDSGATDSGGAIALYGAPFPDDAGDAGDSGPTDSGAG